MAIFNWFKKDQNETKTKRVVSRPAARKVTEDMVCNVDLCRGLYHNSYPGLKLGGFSAGAPIDVPVAFMGIPAPEGASAGQQAILDDIVVKMSVEMRNVHREGNREGTIWIWPWYDSKKQALRWEHIRDDAVTKILKDPITMDVTEIWVEEELEMSTDTDSTKTIKKTRKFRYDKITSTIAGVTRVTRNVAGVTRVTRNVAGVLPVPFANKKDSGDTRGHSDYERIIPDVKAYADIYKQMLEDLAQFRTKMIQYTGDVDSWLKNNAFDSTADVDIADDDFIVNLVDQEKTEFIIPQRIASGYIEALKTCFRKIVEGSGIPEIAWGLKTEGNMASVEENMDTLMQYVEDKRNQYTQAWETLLSASLRLMGIAKMSQGDSTVKVTWDKLDGLSQKTRSEIIKNISEAVSKVVNVAGATKRQIFNIWKSVLPDATEDEYEDFESGLRDMAGHRAFTNAPYIEQLDAAGLGDDDE